MSTVGCEAGDAYRRLELKNISQIEHSRHRSPTNFAVNPLAALIAYTFKEKKSSLNIRVKELEKLAPVLV